SGVVFVIFAYQDISGIDVRFRRNLDILFFKSYIDDPKMKKILNEDDEALTLLRDMTRQATYYHNYEARAIAIGVAKWGDMLYLKIPHTRPRDVTIQTLSAIGKRDALKEMLVRYIVDKGLLDPNFGLTRDMIYGLCIERLGHYYTDYDFSSRDLVEIYRRAAARTCNTSVLVPSINWDETKKVLAALLHAVGGLTFKEIEQKYGISHGSAHRYYHEFRDALKELPNFRELP
ncbi:MAG: hypothetical protein ACTSU5_06295, partial [Promethearchaeota archaeon]